MFMTHLDYLKLTESFFSTSHSSLSVAECVCGVCLGMTSVRRWEPMHSGRLYRGARGSGQGRCILLPSRTVAAKPLLPAACRANRCLAVGNRSTAVAPAALNEGAEFNYSKCKRSATRTCHYIHDNIRYDFLMSTDTK